MKVGSVETLEPEKKRKPRPGISGGGRPNNGKHRGGGNNGGGNNGGGDQPNRSGFPKPAITSRKNPGF